VRRTLLASTSLAAILWSGDPPALAQAEPPDPAPISESRSYRDPIEGVNRKIFWFNDKVDVWVLEPVATGWEWVSPRRVRTSVSNFFANLRFPIIAVNDLMQGKFVDSASDVGRFAVNTTVGVLGFFDPATRFGLEEHNEDFGQTLGVWGLPPGPYLVLPFLGPSNPRDAVGFGVDYALSVTPFFVDTYILIGVRAIDIVNERSLILDEVRDAKEAAIDYYSFVRDAYAQRREALIKDGETMSPEVEEDLYHPGVESEGATQ
jgi:phospholipid-binding lipoprotein MlaA